jgi:hypothetical protein
MLASRKKLFFHPQEIPTGEKFSKLAVLTFYNTQCAEGDVPSHFLAFQGIPCTI